MSYLGRGRMESIYNVPVDNLVYVKDLKTAYVKYIVNGVDATQLANGVIFNTDAGSGFFYSTRVIFTATTITAHTSVASISIGTNSAAFDNMLAITAATGLTATGTYIITNKAAATTRTAASAVVNYKVTTAAVGTVETYSIQVDGFYEDHVGATQLLAG